MQIRDSKLRGSICTLRRQERRTMDLRWLPLRKLWRFGKFCGLEGWVRPVTSFALPSIISRLGIRTASARANITTNESNRPEPACRSIRSYMSSFSSEGYPRADMYIFPEGQLSVDTPDMTMRDQVKRAAERAGAGAAKTE